LSKPLIDSYFLPICEQETQHDGMVRADIRVFMCGRLEKHGYRSSGAKGFGSHVETIDYRLWGICD